MYRRLNGNNQSAKKQNNKPKNTDARKELEAEEKEGKKAPGEKLIDIMLKTGNENVCKELLGNQKGQGEEEEDLFGFFSEEPKEKAKPAASKKNEIKENEEEDDLFDFFKEAPKEKAKPAASKKGMQEKDEDEGDDLFGFLSEAPKENKKPAAQKQGMQEKDADEGNIFDLSNDNIIEQKKEIISTAGKKIYGQKKPEANIYPGQRPAIQEFYEDSEQEKKEQTGWDDIKADFNKPDKIAPDLRAQKGKKKRLKGRGAKKNADNDINVVNADQEGVAGLNFSLHKLPKRNRPGAFRRFLTNLAIAAGNTLGKGINWIGAGLAWLFNPSYRSRFNRGQSKDTTNPDIPQEKRDHDLIPGWNGEKFQKDPDGQDEILADFRRIPTVWSMLTAAQAEDSDGKPLPPKISVYVRQGGEAKDVSVNGTDPGHTGLGIEYSRFSRRSNRYERYNLRYGFFPAGKEKKAGAISMTSSAVIPGQLQEEAYSNFTIRRTFPATAGQVNKILKASETYADKGYNSFNRNCTSFVREMVQDVAGIPAGDKIFEQEIPGFSSLVNFGLFAGKSSENTERASMEARFKHLGSGNDLSYGGEGNKRANQQDYRQYKESLANNNGGYIGKSDLPNAVAENMRRLEGEDAGTISSKQYFGTATVSPNEGKSSGGSGSSGEERRHVPELRADNILRAINTEAAQLINTILNVAGKRSMQELVSTPGLDEGLVTILPQIQFFAAPLYDVKDKNNDPNKLRDARSTLDKEINDLNAVLNIFHNDERLHLPVLHLISLLEWGIHVVDKAYDNVNFGKDVGGDLGYLRDKMDNPFDISYEKRNPDPKSNKKKIRNNTNITPSHYEAYLQIYKDPEKAIDTYARFCDLARKGKKNRTKPEEEEYEKLRRIERLAWQFDNSHNYMLEKNSYNQQDVDYAFSLDKLEKKGEVFGPMLLYSASGIYKSLIFEKIFGEFTQRFENNFTMEDVHNEKMIQDWLDNDMTTCVDRRPDEIESVIKGLKKTMPGSTPEYLLKQLMIVIKDDWIGKVFDNGKFLKMKNRKEDLMFNAKDTVQKAFKKIAKKSNLKTKLMQIIRRVFNTEANIIQT